MTDVQSWRTTAQIQAECDGCAETWHDSGKAIYTAARRHAARTGHKVRVEVWHAVIYEPKAA